MIQEWERPGQRLIPHQHSFEFHKLKILGGAAPCESHNMFTRTSVNTSSIFAFSSAFLRETAQSRLCRRSRAFGELKMFLFLTRREVEENNLTDNYLRAMGQHVNEEPSRINSWDASVNTSLSDKSNM